MKYEIKNRFSGEIQFIAEIDCDENTEKSIKIGLAVKWAIENKANLREADLSEANLRKANLREADLRWANLSEANLRKANLREANLYKANLREADLRWANLSEANLREADLREANLSEANLREANLSEANLREANLDYSCLPLSCKSLKAGFDDKQIKQLLYHVLSVVKNSNNVSDKMKKNLMTKKLLKIANESHLIYKHDCEELK